MTAVQGLQAPAEDSVLPAPWWAWTQPCLAVALVYFAFARLAFALPDDALTPFVFWPATGLAIVAMYRWGGIGALGVVLGAAAAVADSPLRWSSGLGFAAFELAGAGLAAYALRRSAFNDRLESRGDLLLLLGLCVFAGAVVALGTSLFLTAHAAAASPWSEFWRAWVAIVLGAVMVALPLLAGNRDALHSALGSRRWRATLVLVVALLFSAGLLVATSAASPPQRWALACLCGTLLGLLVLRGGIAVASACVLAAGLCAALAVAADVQPLAAAWHAQPSSSLWLALATPLLLCVMVHALALDMTNIERRWLLALGGAGLGVAEWRANRDAGRTSPLWRALLGNDSVSMSSWLAQLHDDDRGHVRALLRQLDAGEVSNAHREVRVAHAADWRWLDLQLVVVQRDRGGRCARLFATLSDTSEQHHAEQRQRLSASLFQHLHEGLLIADAEMRVLDANPAYTAILGVPRAELVGSVPSLLKASSADPLVRQQRLLMWAGLRDAGRWRGEVVERRRNGEQCTLQVTISTVSEPGGATRYHVLVISDITEQRLQRDRLERQAHFDELTRLPNRARLQQMLAEAMLAAEADGHLLTVCYLDLDRFKPVNDRFGHAAGDRLLVELAGRLRSALRSNQIWSDAAGRLGGDEFVLLLRASTMEESRLAVERVLRVVAQPYVIDPAVDPVHVTASMGATVYPIDRSDADTLLRHADHAMYGAKQAGRNGYQFFDPEYRKQAEERVMAIGRVQEALDNREFVLYYQPKVDMRHGVVLGLEALLRWDHPQQGLIAPLQFLPLIENTGLSSHIGDWVLSQAIEHLAQWRNAGFDISISVNVSARHLQEPDFVQRLSELLARHTQDLSSSLELEVLETAAHADIQATSALLARCRALGVHFALDDFGTGYSTLTYLKQLPVDVLKIDRSFVHHMLDDAQDRAIVEGVIGLARTFQCVVVAEGVESPAQARALLDMGCNIGQGTGIAAPMPASAVSAWIRDYRGLVALAAAPQPAAARTAGE